MGIFYTLQRFTWCIGTVLTVLALPNLCFAEVDVSVFTGRRSTDLVYHLSDGSNPSKTITGTEYGTAFRYQPWRHIPASLGFMATSYTLDTGSIANAIAGDDLGDSLQYYSTTGGGSTTGLIYGPQLTVWYPINYVQPYIRVGQMYGEEVNSLSGEATTLRNVSPGKVTNSTHADTFDVATTLISIGFCVSPIKILRLNHDFSYPILALEHHVYTIAIFGEYSVETGTRSLVATSRSNSAATGGTTTTTTSSRITSKEIVDQDSNSTMVRFGLEYRF